MDAFQPAYTIDSLGLPSESNVSHDMTSARSRAVTLEVLRRDPPGQAMQDRFSQARLGFKNHAYLAITTLMDWVAASKFTVQQKKKSSTVNKALGSASSESSEWHPLDEEHAACELYANPNPTQTFGGYIGQRTMCRQLFGTSYEWVVKDRGGRPREMYVLLPQYLTSLPISSEYPNGAFLLSVPQPMYGLNYAGYTRIDRRNIVIDRMPNPMIPWDGYSPLTAGAEMCDVLNSVIAARKKANDSGLSIDALLKLQGASEPEIKRVTALIKDRYSGVDRGERVMVTNADEIDISPMSTTPDKMAFGESYRDSINFVLALFGVPPALAGLTEATSYAQLYASLKQFCIGKLGAELRAIQDCWTHKVVRIFWPDCKVMFEPPSIEDDAARPGILLAGWQADAIKLNEYRAGLNMKADPDGDLYFSQWQAKIAPAPPISPAVTGQPGVLQSQSAPEGDPDEDESAYPNQLMAHVMGAFGVVDSVGEQNSSGDDETVLESDDTPALVAKSLEFLFRKSKDASGHEHKGKGAGGGQFGSGSGATTDSRHNPDLDEAFGKPVEKEKKPTEYSARHNPDLDDLFDPKPKDSKADPVRGKPIPIPSTPAMDASGEFDTDQTKTFDNQADAHPAAQTAKKAVAVLKAKYPQLAPVAKIAVAKLKQAPIPATPLAHRQAANPQDWMPKVLAIAVPLLAKAMGLDRNAATALLTVGLTVALHQISKQNIPVVQPVKGKGGKPPVLKPKIHGSTVIPTAKPIQQAVPIPVAKRVGTSGPPQPKNAAGKGSLPKRMGKSLEPRAEIADYFATMLGEVCPA